LISNIAKSEGNKKDFFMLRIKIRSSEPNLMSGKGRETRAAGRASWRSTGVQLSFPGTSLHDGQQLETQLGTEADPPAVMSTVYKYDFVAGLKTKSDRAQECLDSRARIKDSIHVTRSKIAHAACKSVE
jgi:hypothetical protein